MRCFVLLLAAYIFLLSLAPNFQGIQFVKVAALVEHYKAHQSGPQQFDSFVSFLLEHYDKDHQTNENEHNLPFKTPVATISILIVQQVITNTEFSWVSLPSSRGKHAYDDLPGFPKNRHGSIWNPPKLT